MTPRRCVKCSNPAGTKQDPAFVEAVRRFEQKNPETELDWTDDSRALCLSCFQQFARFVDTLTPEDKYALIVRGFAEEN